MNDELYADLLASAEEMVKIEQGELTLNRNMFIRIPILMCK